MFQAIRKNVVKSHWTVTRQSSEVTRPSADCQTTFLGRFKQFGNIQRKSLIGHATVVGGHATVGRLSKNVFWTFRAIRKSFLKSRLTVTRQSSEVTRPSADCQTKFFGRFKQFGNISRESFFNVFNGFTYFNTKNSYFIVYVFYVYLEIRKIRIVRVLLTYFTISMYFSCVTIYEGIHNYNA